MKKRISFLTVLLLMLCIYTAAYADSTLHFDSTSGISGDSQISSTRAVSAGSLYLSGTAYAELDKNPFSDVDNDFTVSVWAYAEDNPSWSRIFDFSTGGLDSYGNPDNYIFLTLNSNGNAFYAFPRLEIKQNGVAQSVTSAKAVLRNNWYNITVVKSGTQLKMYINGEPCGIADGITNSAAMDFTSLYIGKSHWSDPLFNGYIDEMAVYSRAFSDSEVKTAAGFGNAQLCISYPMDALTELATNNRVTRNSSYAYKTYCFNFNGSDAYATIAGNPFTEVRDNFTVSVWVYPRSEKQWARVFDFGSGTDEYVFLTTHDYPDSKPRFAIKNNGIEQQLISDIAVELNKWHNITVTKNGSVAKIYIDGVLGGTNYEMTNSGAAFTADKLYLGKSQYSDPLFYGRLDELNIYNRAMTAEEILQMLNDEHIIAECALFDGDTPVIALGANGTLTAKAKLSNPAENAASVQLIAAVYDTDGRLCGVSCSDKATLSGGDSVELSTKLSSGDYSDAVFYLWQSSSEIYPITSAYRVSRYDNVNFPVLNDAAGTDEYSHDPSIFKDPQSGKYYVYNTHTYYPAVSDDLIHWTTDPRGNMPLPPSVISHYSEAARQQSQTMWAPDIQYNPDDPDGKPYYLYYCYSGIGGIDNYFVSSSSIGLMKADNPEMTDAVDCGFIYSTSDDGVDNGKVNAIDQNIVTDAKTGDKYMVYGSFWRGIHMFKLNDDGTAIAKDTDGNADISDFDVSAEETDHAKAFGLPLVSRWYWAGVEGPYIIYNPKTEYYYCFTSYDSFTYNYTIRVGRSKTLAGPYYDADGRPLNAEFSQTTEPYGYKLAGSYQFEGDEAYYAPGHNSVLNDDGEWYLAHHTRRIPHGGATLHIRRLLWTEDGWPIASPERYSGEELQAIPEQLICGSWDILAAGANTDGLVKSERLTLLPDHTVADSDAVWSFDGNHTLTVSFSGRTLTLEVLTAYDRDRKCPTLVFTGKDSSNIAQWGKKSVYQRLK